MPREYYVYPNGTPIAVAGNNEYATQIPMSASDATDVYTAISDKADNVSLPASQGGTDLTLVTTGDKYNWDNNDASSKVSKSGDTMTGSLTFSTANTNAISYQGTYATYPMIKFIDNTTDGNGNGVYIGGGGQTIIGGGESSNVMASQVGTSGSEAMYVGNDNDVYILSNLQSGWASRKEFKFDTNGNMVIGGQVARAGGNTTWIKGRDVAPVKTTSGGGSWNPVVSAKSVNGAWGIGTLNDVLYFSYGTDANYNNNTNTTNNYSIDSSGNFSGKSADSAKLNGYASDTAATANTIVRRDANKYVYATYYNSAINAENINSYTSYVMFKDSNHWMRCTTLANFKTWFGTANAATKASIVGNYSGGGTNGNLRFHAQTSVVSASGTGVQLVTAAALNTIFGVSNCGAANTAVFVSNGDGNSWGGHFDGCNFIGSGTPAWWATMNTSVSGSVRINWLAVYFG